MTKSERDKLEDEQEAKIKKGETRLKYGMNHFTKNMEKMQDTLNALKDKADEVCADIHWVIPEDENEEPHEYIPDENEWDWYHDTILYMKECIEDFEDLMRKIYTLRENICGPEGLPNA